MTSPRSLSARICALTGACLVAVACGGSGDNSTPVTHEKAPSTAAMKTIVDAAKGEGSSLQFITYFSGGEQELKAWQDSFNSYYGLNVTFHDTPGVNIFTDLTKVSQEIKGGRAPSTDVLMAETNSIAQLGQQTMQPVDWSFAASLPKEAIFENGEAVAVMTRLPGITYNTTKVGASDVPKTFADFARQTKFTAATTSVGSNYATLASPSMLGEQPTISLVTQLARNIKGFVECGSQIQPLANGQYDLFGLDCGGFEADQAAANGAPVKHAIFTDAAMIQYFTMSVPVQAAHPNLAKLFIAYLLTNSAQGIMRKYDYGDLHLIKGSLVAKLIAAEQSRGSRFTELSVDFARQNAAVNQRVRPQIQQILAKKGQ